jgi:hypothetical protein
MPTPELNMPVENITELNRHAEEAGFVVLNLSDVYDGQDIPSLWVAEWDHHPDAGAHVLFADRLYEMLLDHSETIPMPQPREAGSQ